MDEMETMPDILAAENVEGLISSNEGENYISLHNELIKRGYQAGAIKLNAQNWIPQSRLRIFIIAVKQGITLPAQLCSQGPNWLHSDNIIRAASRVKDWIWWNMPEPADRKCQLSDIIEWDAPVDESEKTNQLLTLLSEKHEKQLEQSDNIAITGYKRTRSGKQRLELRFDGIAGCLRTPKGGSSRQILVMKRNGVIHTRLLTVRETARLMGAPENYWLPEKYNDAYMAMGDAVAVPAVHYLSEHLLFPLAIQAKAQSVKGRKEQNDDTRAVVLFVTRKAKQSELPINSADLKAESAGQVAGLSKSAVQSILADYGIVKVLAAEGGRTSRGSIKNMEDYVAFLNELNEQGKCDLDFIEAW